MSDLKPPGIKEELQQSENGHVEVQIVTRVTLGGVQKLAPNETDQEKTVDRQRHHLSETIGYCNRSVTDWTLVSIQPVALVKSDANMGDPDARKPYQFEATCCS